MEDVGKAIRYIEEHITEELSAEEIAGQVNLSPFYFQKGFAMLCGFTVAEYIRRRRLTLAGSELAAGDLKVIEAAVKYGYDSPDSFTRAFNRFHGVTPSRVKKERVMLKSFAPLKIKISFEGGYLMDYRIEKKNEFAVIAKSGIFSYENAEKEVPQFWQEHFKNGGGKTVMGVYGINIDEKMGQDSFEYLIADPFDGKKDVPEGYVVKTVPSFTWAVFPCTGAMPDALKDVNTKIFSEWLPALKEYEFAAGYCVEYYEDPSKYAKGTMDENYYCEIWIPIKQK